MDQQTPQTIKAGVLAKECFKSEQERLEAFTAAMIVSAFVGPQGETGDTGSDGDPATAPDWELYQERSVPIPDASTFVDTGLNLSNKIVRIEGTPTTATNFAVGAIDGTKVWFIFQSPAVAVNGTGFSVGIYSMRAIQ